MSGVETVAIILPILFSAVKHWNSAKRSFKRYKEYPPEFEYFQQRFDIQKSIFRRHCQLLLAISSDGENANAMLDELQHRLWADKDLEKKLALQLGEFREPCGILVKAIEGKLKMFEDEWLLAPKEKEKLHRNFGKKLKFAISESRMDRDLKEIRSLNEDFRTLTDQTCSRAAKRVDSASPPPPDTEEKIQEFAKIRKAVDHFCQALGNSCKLYDHEGHSIHFRLGPQHKIVGPEPPHLLFNVAFTHTTSRPPACADPIRIAIKSTETHASVPSPGFRVRHDFCIRIQRCLQENPVNKYVGYFQRAGDYTQFVYLSDPDDPGDEAEAFSLNLPPPPPNSQAEAVSLAQVRDMKLPLDKRIRLAKQLASAVLQFHETPLMKRSWRNEDVMFFGNRRKTLGFPYLNVQIRRSQQNDPPPNTAGNSFIRNPYLFSLGVVLIELAFQKPFQSLREDQDHHLESNSTVVDWVAANRLAENTESFLGPSYAHIVDKCLRCAFRTTTSRNLRHVSLQEAFYGEVVRELDRLEGVARELDLTYRSD